MSDLQIENDGILLTLEEALTCTPPSLYIAMEAQHRKDYLGIQITEEQAVQIVCHLVKVFNVPNSNIEVIHFAEGYDRAEVLRAYANKLDARKSPSDAT